jgi:glyoxylase-like metal-dependent hydrolase (beta-lactamase superfamily II)
MRETYYRSRLIPMDRIPIQLSPVVVETGGRRILIDAGIAPAAENHPHAGRLALGLEAAQFAPDSVDLVVLTHAHPDHIGALLHPSTLEPFFPNAEVVVSSAEADRWSGLSGEPRPAWGLPLGSLGILRALDGRVRTVEDGEEIVPGMRAVESAGHTRGHMAVTVETEDRDLLIVGDAIADINVAFEHPEWHASFDGDPERAARTRRRLLDRAATDEMLILAYHLPFPGVGYALRNGSAFRWYPAGWLVLP